MKKGHTHINILKIDIEGWEFETITTLHNPYIASGEPLPFGQLQLEIHIWGKTFAEYLTWWETLEKAGLRPFWTEASFFFARLKKIVVLLLFFCPLIYRILYFSRI
jgi:hypothetical protein